MPHLALTGGIALGDSEPEIAPASSISAAAMRPRTAEGDARLRRMVDSYFSLVARVLRNAGTPEADIDDAVQRTFIAASNRLNDIREGAERSFLLRIALNTAAHARRSLARRREVNTDEWPELVETHATPEQLTQQMRARQLLDRVLSEMGAELRTVFSLHEFEELNTFEIAEVLAIPRGTVASRLRRAREEFQERVRRLEGTSPGRKNHG